MDKKVIILTIELKKRELLSRIYFAYYLAQQGYRVYITELSKIDIFFNHINSCILFHKSHLPGYDMNNLKTRLGAKVCFIDEEVGVAISKSKLDDFVKHRYANMQKHIYSDVFVIGKYYEQSLNKLDVFKDVNLHYTGWLRIDLWKKKYHILYNNEIKEIKKRYRKGFILLASSFGVISEKIYDYRMNHIKDEFNLKWNKDRRRAFLNYVELIKTLASKISKPIVIRPHVNETMEDWEDIIEGIDNVYLEKDFDLMSWIIVSDVIITYGSTTVIQAIINDIPTIQYKVKNIEGITDMPVFDLSIKYDNIQDVINFINHNSEVVVNRNQLLRYVSNVDDDKFAVNDIINVLNKYNIYPQKYFKLSLLEKYKYKYKYRIDKLKNFLHNTKLKIFNQYHKQDEKIPNGIQYDEIYNVMETLSEIENNNIKDFHIDNIFENTFCIEKKGMN